MNFDVRVLLTSYFVMSNFTWFIYFIGMLLCIMPQYLYFFVVVNQSQSNFAMLFYSCSFKIL